MRDCIQNAKGWSMDTENPVDPEIQAMTRIAAALKELEADVVRRVLKWANERYQVKPPQPGTSLVPIGPVDPAEPRAQRTFSDVMEVFDAANPENGLDRVLVVAYWYQQQQGNDDWDSQSINTNL